MAPLSREALDTFLAAPLIARLGVVADNGDPYVVPIWYDWVGDGALIAVRARAAFVPYLRQRGRCCLSIAEDIEPLRRALITGRAEVVRETGPDTGVWLERSRKVCRRYMGDGAGDDYQDETLERPCIWFKIHADEVVSWDSPAWHPKYYT